jgi:P63C domain-containing protein
VLPDLKRSQLGPPALGPFLWIDEATGYQKVRAKNALQVKLQAFIADDLQDWALMFPGEFWLEWARLEGMHYTARSRPLRWGKYIMLFVCDAIDGDVGKELRKNPDQGFFETIISGSRNLGATRFTIKSNAS